jgi:predicted nucleic acid-binding protein
MPDRPPSCVFDCNVYLQAAINPAGPAGRCLQCAFESRLKLFVSR